MSKKLIGLPEIPGVHWLHEAFFDLDLDANFTEAKNLFGKMYPYTEFLLRPEDQMEQYNEEYSDEESKVIDTLMSGFTEP